MNDDLTPAEQARNGRWASKLLNDWRFNEARVAMDSYVNQIDPPETVESLRAERDAAQKKLAQAECVIRDHQAALNAMRDERNAAWCNALRANARFDEEQEEHVQALNKLSAANFTLARLRATHTEAEAAWRRCKYPRVWHKGDPEPEGVTRVRDKNDLVWGSKGHDIWGNGTYYVSGDRLIEGYGPLTEVPSED